MLALAPCWAVSPGCQKVGRLPYDVNLKLSPCRTVMKIAMASRTTPQRQTKDVPIRSLGYLAGNAPRLSKTNNCIYSLSVHPDRDQYSHFVKERILPNVKDEPHAYRA